MLDPRYFPNHASNTFKYIWLIHRGDTQSWAKPFIFTPTSESGDDPRVSHCGMYHVWYFPRFWEACLR